MTDPSQISNLIMDIRAEKASHTYNPSAYVDNVNSVPDLSGKGNDLVPAVYYSVDYFNNYQIKATQAPVPLYFSASGAFNSLPVLHCNHGLLMTQENLTAPTYWMDRPFTLCLSVAIIARSENGNEGIFSQSDRSANGGGTSQWSFGLNGPPAYQSTFFSTHTSSETSRSSTPGVLGEANIVCLWTKGRDMFDSTQWSTLGSPYQTIDVGMTVNGHLAETPMSTAATRGAAGLVFGGTTLNTASGNVAADIQQIVAYDRVLKDWERNSVEKYIGKRINKPIYEHANRTSLQFLQWNITTKVLSFSATQKRIEQPDIQYDPITQQYYAFYSVWTDNTPGATAYGDINVAKGPSLDKLVVQSTRPIERSLSTNNAGFITSPSLFFDSRTGIWYMYYIFSNTATFNAPSGYVGVATGSKTLDGPWTSPGYSLIYTTKAWEGSPTSYDVGVLRRASVMYFNNQYIMHYGGVSTRSDGNYAIQQYGYATSMYPDKGFTPYAGNPTIRAGARVGNFTGAPSTTVRAETTDEHGVSDISVIPYNGYYLAFGTALGGNNQNGASNRRGVGIMLRSNDLINWERLPMTFTGLIGSVARPRLIPLPPGDTTSLPRIAVDDFGSNIYVGQLAPNSC